MSIARVYHSPNYPTTWVCLIDTSNIYHILYSNMIILVIAYVILRHGIDGGLTSLLYLKFLNLPCY